VGGAETAHAVIAMTQNVEQVEWLYYREAAELMHRPAAYLRTRHADGSYKYWPQIERWQPGGHGTRLFVRREHVEAWIEASRTPPPCPIKQDFSVIGYESIVPDLRRLGSGGEKLIRSLGLGK
jgi:hypothetical protein